MEEVEYFGQERNKRIFKDLSCHAKLLDLLLHLRQIHVLIYIGQRCQEYQHSIVVGDVYFHYSF